MTLCAAGLLIGGSKGPGFITVVDRKASFFGGLFSTDDAVWKMEWVNSDWVVMISGDLSPMVPMLHAVKNEAKARFSNVRDFAHLCSALYRRERKLIVKSEILTDFDVDTYEEYQELRNKDAAFYTLITERIQKVEEGWSLLFAGFDRKKEPHIFVITERGKIQYSDLTGYAAIGAGAFRAHVSLSRSYKVWDPAPIAIYHLLVAKFDAESAEGVGTSTMCYTRRAGDHGASISQKMIQRVRDLYKAMPTLPEKVSEEIAEDIKSEAESYERYLAVIKKAKAKRLAARKSGSEP